MLCKLCGQGFQGSQMKAAQHFTIKNNCAKISVEQMAEIWNKTKYGFDPSHQRKIVDFLKSHGFQYNRCGSGREPAGKEEFEDSEEERRAVKGGDDDGESDAEDMEVRREVERARGKMRKEKAIDEDSTPDEDDDGDDDDQGADLGASLDGGLMGDGRRGQEGAARAMKEAAGSKKRKTKAKMTTTEARLTPSQPKKSRVIRQTSMLETFDQVWQREFSDSVLQWWYVSGIPFEAARRPEYHTMRKKLLECPPYAHPALPTHRVISCDDIPQQQRVVADMVAAIRRDIEATGATILTDGRKSITSDQIECVAGWFCLGEAVVERWKDVFDKFGVDKVNAICTDSASAYVAASKLLAEEEVKYSRITWLPCAVHVCNLLLSDIAKDGRDGSLGTREDTIIRARTVMGFMRQHGAALSLYRRFSAAHPSSASAVASSSNSTPPSSQRRGRELVYPVQTRFATHYLMLERLLDRRRALEALMMSDDWLRTAWRRSIFLQARWVRHQVRYVPFWEHVEDIVALMMPVMQLLRRLDRGGRVMTRMWSWSFVMVDRVARASLNRTSKNELHIVVQACQARTLRTQLAEFHSREGNWTYGGVEGDRDAAACKGEKETSQVKRRNQLGFIKLTRLVEISTNLRLSRCQGRGFGYVLPWEDAEEETEDDIPPPRDEGVRPADRVTEAQRDRQVQRGRKDRLSKAPPSVETYFGCRATVLMVHELESVYDPEPDPMDQDEMEAEPWSDPDDLAVESEPGGSDDDDDDTPLIQIPRPRTRAFTAAAAPSPAARPPSSAPDVSQPGPEDRVESPTPHPSTDRRRQGGTHERVDEGDDDDGYNREGYEGSRMRMIPVIPRHADMVTTTTTRAATVDRLWVVCGSPRDNVATDAVVQAGEAAGRVLGVQGAQVVQGVLAEEKPAEAVVVASSPIEVAPSPAEFAVASAEGAAASAEGAGGFAGGSGNDGEVGRPSGQLGVSFSDSIFDVSLGHPPTPAGERVGVDVDAAATPVCQILRDIPSCSTGDISSSMLQEAAEGAPGWSGQHERAAGDDGECQPVQEKATKSEQDRIDREERRRAQGLTCRCEMTQSVASRARVARMLETGVEAGDAEGECGGAGIGDAGERPTLPLERQAREDPLQADRRGRMAEASRRLMAEGPAYVPCSPSVPSSTTGVSTPAHVEGTGAAEAARGPSPTPAGESPSPQSRKKKMRVGKSLSTVRRVMQTMRASQPGLAGLHPRTRAVLGGDVVADAIGWQERVSDRATDQPMSAPAEATLPHTAGRTAGTGDHAEHNAPPGRSMVAHILREDVRAATTQRPSQAPVVWESGTNDLEMPYGQRRRVSVYDLLRPQGGVEAAPQGEIHAPDTTHAPAGGTGRGDGVKGVVPRRRRKDIVDDDDA
ncbi:hypothetical protein CBR_g46765 [Chara braunii]|uniref:DUF659 domain-containing protein n=1 Tax=Chara braunii TaxID=69332 RepID=A0A388K474_CHABU|nr:hypothetical protein CBR_g46765 [Chara braunii]|eukprot:GBG64809.1 hypothetical protein CBR_g46765 [Chara braunii]